MCGALTSRRLIPIPVQAKAEWTLLEVLVLILSWWNQHCWVLEAGGLDQWRAETLRSRQLTRLEIW
jgi:hypothetical protein